MNRKMNHFLKTKMPTSVLICLLPLFVGCASNTKAVKDTEKLSAESSQSKLITQISTTEDPKTSIVRVHGNQLLTYTSLKQPSPLSVLLYFP